MLGATDCGPTACARVEHVLLEHLDEVHRKVAELKRLERPLRAVAADSGNGAASGCPAVEQLVSTRTGFVEEYAAPPRRRRIGCAGGSRSA